MVTEENTGNENETLKNDESIVNTTTEQQNTPVPINNVPPVTEEPPIIEPPNPKVYTVSAKMYPHEYEFMQKVLESRQGIVNDGKPLTRDMNHFLRQCIRFTLNYKKDIRFYIPDNIDRTTIDT